MQAYGRISNTNVTLDMMALYIGYASHGINASV